MSFNDRLLFLRYALPCAQTLVQRGIVSQEKVDSLIKKVSTGEEVPEGAEMIFRVAIGMCNIIAKKSGKPIDADVIREYFLFQHDEIIDKRYEEKGDFDPEACRTIPGNVIEVRERLLVRTPKGNRNARKDFMPDVKIGDLVVVHRDFAVERISIETAGKMLRMKGLPEDFFE